MLKTNMLQSKKEQQEMAASILTKAKEEEFIALAPPQVKLLISLVKIVIYMEFKILELI